MDNIFQIRANNELTRLQQFSIPILADAIVHKQWEVLYGSEDICVPGFPILPMELFAGFINSESVGPGSDAVSQVAWHWRLFIRNRARSWNAFRKQRFAAKNPTTPIIDKNLFELFAKCDFRITDKKIRHYRETRPEPTEVD